jgi:uncharacterized protein (TIGR03382 family)
MDGNADCDVSCWADAASNDFGPTTMAAGAAHGDLTVDLCGEARGATPTAGAIEGEGPGSLTPGVLWACPDGGDSGDTGDDASGEKGCGCGTGGSASLVAVGVALALGMRRRGRA